MKKSSIIIVVAVVALLVVWGVSSYNSLVQNEIAVQKEWANVESQYQRRANLIDNLVSTVKGYADHEKSTLDAVVSARAKATEIKIDPKTLTSEQLQNFQSAQGELSSALGRLIMTVENYPNLKANENFLELQAQLEGTENRIQVSHQTYNEIVALYDNSRRKFPTVLIAGMLGFGEKPMFKAEIGAEKAPKVQF